MSIYGVDDVVIRISLHAQDHAALGTFVERIVEAIETDIGFSSGGTLRKPTVRSLLTVETSKASS